MSLTERNRAAGTRVVRSPPGTAPGTQRDWTDSRGVVAEPGYDAAGERCSKVGAAGAEVLGRGVVAAGGEGDAVAKTHVSCQRKHFMAWSARLDIVKYEI